jgi:predicted metal-dependent hydrolase
MAGKTQGVAPKTITIDGEQVQINVQPSDSYRSVDIEFKPGRITIRHPRGRPIDVAAIIDRKRDLIARKYREATSKTPILEDGVILIHGTPRKILTEPTPGLREPKVTLLEDTVTIQYEPHGNPALILKRWVTQQTENLIQETLEKHREQLERLPEITRVADTTRWGYCNKKGWIIYNWQLATLPRELAEYVIIHEAVHLTHFHHRKGFHHKLEQITPDHQTHQKRLQQYQAIPPNHEYKADPLNPSEPS